MPWKGAAVSIVVAIALALIIGAWDFVITTKTFMAVATQHLEQIDRTMGEIKADLKGMK